VLPTVDRKISARFEKEVRDFRGRTGAGGDVVIDARERPDDDILLAAASAAWLGVRSRSANLLFCRLHRTTPPVAKRSDIMASIGFRRN